MKRKFIKDNYTIFIQTIKYNSFYTNAPVRKARYSVYDNNLKEWLIFDKEDRTNFIDYKPLEVINHIKENLFKLLGARA